MQNCAVPSCGEETAALHILLINPHVRNEWLQFISTMVTDYYSLTLKTHLLHSKHFLNEKIMTY